MHNAELQRHNNTDNSIVLFAATGVVWGFTDENRILVVSTAAAQRGAMVLEFVACHPIAYATFEAESTSDARWFCAGSDTTCADISATLCASKIVFWQHSQFWAAE